VASVLVVRWRTVTTMVPLVKGQQLIMFDESGSSESSSGFVEE
jgi:hypothetical protein